MLRALFPVLILGLALSFSVVAQAQNMNGNGTGGAQNCGFSTFKQRQEDVSGIGGFCERNNIYQPPAMPRSLHYQRR